MEKEHQPDSMATITMKPEYPPSEVYSASEPPPAYRQRVSSSVQIARIAALTVVAASFILGAFILASSWVAARASCHQLEQLDAMLDKELALEGRAYGNDALMPDEPLPVANAHALHGVPPPMTSSSPAHPSLPREADSQVKDDSLNQAESKIDEDKLQKIDDDNTKNEQQSSASEESSESDSSAEDDEELDAIRPMFKLPIQFDLDELAGAFLANNQKGRMNCVVERRHDDPMERRFPFNILGAFAPRNAHAERVAIICHGGDEPSRPMGSFPEPQSQVFAFPLSGPARLPLRPQERAPAPDAMIPPPFGPMRRPAPFPLPVKLLGGRYFIETDTGPNRAHDDDEEEDNEPESDDDENEYENMEEAQNEDNDAGEEERPGDDLFSTEQDFNVQDFITDFNIRGMLCAAHTLQLAIKDAIAENASVASLLNVARRIVSILRRPNYTHALKSANKRKAIIDCPTRWTSTFNMLKRLLTLHNFINGIEEVSLLVSPVFWTQMTIILQCLKPANEATLKLQRQDLTIGDFYIVWANCKNVISAIDHDFAISLTRSMQAREIKLFNNDVVLEALYIDRRLNVILNDEQCEKAKSLLKETYQKLKNLNQMMENVDGEDNSIGSQQSHNVAVASTSQGTLALETLLMRAERARGSSRQLRSFDLCLNELVVGPRVPINENIINHWNNAAVLSSDLAMVANTVLAAPSTQVSVERLFSSLKFILNPLRSNLGQRLLRDIMLIRQNKDLIN